MDFVIYTNLSGLAWAIIAALAFTMLLRWFDRRAGISFKRDVWDVMATDPRALADYHGRRLLAVAIVIAAALLH